MTRMSAESPWLSDQQEQLWRGWLRLNAELAATLQRELQDDAGLSMPDFEVLVPRTAAAHSSRSPRRDAPPSSRPHPAT